MSSLFLFLRVLTNGQTQYLSKNLEILSSPLTLPDANLLSTTRASTIESAGCSSMVCSTCLVTTMRDRPGMQKRCSTKKKKCSTSYNFTGKP